MESFRIRKENTITQARYSGRSLGRPWQGHRGLNKWMFFLTTLAGLQYPQRNVLHMGYLLCRPLAAMLSGHVSEALLWGSFGSGALTHPKICPKVASAPDRLRHQKNNTMNRHIGLKNLPCLATWYRVASLQAKLQRWKFSHDGVEDQNILTCPSFSNWLDTWFRMGLSVT